VISHWESEEQFKAWTSSPEFIEGHKRGFEDLRKAKEEGKPILGIWIYTNDRTILTGVPANVWTWETVGNFIDKV
jgi:heme-degrading monooxygenase HmoA